MTKYKVVRLRVLEGFLALITFSFVMTGIEQAFTELFLSLPLRLGFVGCRFGTIYTSLHKFLNMKLHPCPFNFRPNSSKDLGHM